MDHGVLRWVLWRNRPGWCLASGLFVIGLGIGYLEMQHNHVVGWLFVGLGALNVVGGIVGRAVTGTWRKPRRSPSEDWLAPLS